MQSSNALPPPSKPMLCHENRPLTSVPRHVNNILHIRQLRVNLLIQERLLITHQLRLQPLLDKRAY